MISKKLTSRGRHTVLPIIGDTLAEVRLSTCSLPALVFRADDGSEAELTIEDNTTLRRGAQERLLEGSKPGVTFNPKELGPLLLAVRRGSQEMSDLESHIRRMYADIVSYGGFGDGVEHGPYNPFEAAANAGLTPFERVGVSIAVLHWLESAVDNSTWKDALNDCGPRVRKLLAAGLLDHEPLVRSAAEAFVESEDAFLAALRPVYERVVRTYATR